MTPCGLPAKLIPGHPGIRPNSAQMDQDGIMISWVPDRSFNVIYRMLGRLLPRLVGTAHRRQLPRKCGRSDEVHLASSKVDA